MGVAETVYEVPGWGRGRLWTAGALVLAHEFDYEVVSADAAAAGLRGRFREAARARPPATLGPASGEGGLRAVSDASALRSASDASGLRAAPHEGGASPPAVTVRERPVRMAHAFVPDAFQDGEHPGEHLPAARRDADRRGGPPPTPAEVVARLVAFFDGADALGDVLLDLSWCTPFQRASVEALRAIPPGEVVSYGELAALAGRPGAQRAIGSLCARNRFALLVPCHRVVAADGIGGYGSTGVEVKRRLLALEGVHL